MRARLPQCQRPLDVRPLCDQENTMTNDAKTRTKLDGERLSQKDLAELISVDERTLRRWGTDDGPRAAVPRNRDGTYNLAAVILWRAFFKRRGLVE